MSPEYLESTPSGGEGACVALSYNCVIADTGGTAGAVTLSCHAFSPVTTSMLNLWPLAHYHHVAAEMSRGSHSCSVMLVMSCSRDLMHVCSLPFHHCKAWGRPSESRGHYQEVIHPSPAQ